MKMFKLSRLAQAHYEPHYIKNAGAVTLLKTLVAL